ncbi:MAG: hypothetical protein ACE5EH_02825 [Gammaproteobacteria bacterium]
MASFRKRGPYQWQAQVRKKGYPLQTKTFDTRAAAETWARAIEVEMDQGTFISRAETESTTLKELLERYLREITPTKKGAATEATRVLAFMKLPLAQRIVAGIRGVDIARYRDERLKEGQCPKKCVWLSQGREKSLKHRIQRESMNWITIP